MRYVMLVAYCVTWLVLGSTATAHAGEPGPPASVTAKQFQPQWGETAIFEVTFRNPLDFPMEGFTAEVLNTVDRRLVPITAKISPKPGFVGNSNSFWQLPGLNGWEAVSYTVTVQLPVVRGVYEYCFAVNIYLLPTAEWGWPWADSGRFCALVAAIQAE